MKLEQAIIIEHCNYGSGYRLLVFESANIAVNTLPGQFIHLRVPGLDGSVLRRPFSIFNVDGNRFSILYKQVGRGTREMAVMPVGRAVSIVGPLGNGFPLTMGASQPVLVGGGYGVAPLYLLASRIERSGVLFIGGRTSADILCVEEFEALGWEVRVTTEDGSMGMKGLVTDALDVWLGAVHYLHPVFFACGPDGLLRALDERVVRGGWEGWLSLDKHMGCGVGACLACVQRVRAPDGTTVWKRVCKDGPVFAAGEIMWDYDDTPNHAK